MILQSAGITAVCSPVQHSNLPRGKPLGKCASLLLLCLFPFLCSTLGTLRGACKMQSLRMACNDDTVPAACNTLFSEGAHEELRGHKTPNSACPLHHGCRACYLAG